MLHDVGKSDAENDAADGQHRALAQQHATIVVFEAPIDFRIPISRVRSSTAVYMD